MNYSAIIWGVVLVTVAFIAWGVYQTRRRFDENVTEFPPMCSRCYEEAEELFPANCDEKPEIFLGAALGQYHCPDCGAMVVAGIPHGDMCKRCIDREHPAFDREASNAEYLQTR